MRKRYYIVNQHLNPETRAVSRFHGRAFVIVSEDGSIEHVAGDEGLTKMLVPVKGELESRENVYGVESVDHVQFGLRSDAYLNEIFYQERERELRNSR